MKAKLIKKEIIAEGTWYFEFAAGEKLEFVPGQFFRLTVENPKYADNRANFRFLGFVNLPNKDNIAASIIRAGPSAFKRSLVEAGEGMEVRIDGIDGKMVLPEEGEKEIVMVTGGIGIAPIKSLLKSIKENTLNHRVFLIYSNTNRARAIWLDELTGYAGENANFKFLPTMTQDTDWGGETRRIDAEFLREKMNVDENFLYYITGTPRFVPDMVRHLREIGAETPHMRFEIFTGY